MQKVQLNKTVTEMAHQKGWRKVDSKQKKITFLAVNLALTVLLCGLKVSALWPHGGAITLFGMVPIIWVSLRYGAGCGVGLGLCFGLLKLLFGLGNFVALGAGQFWGCVFFDYLAGYCVVGLASIFAVPQIKRWGVRLFCSVFCVFFLKFCAHFCSGLLILGCASHRGWWDVSVLSAGYNASYLIPEMLLSFFGIRAITQLGLLEYGLPIARKPLPFSQF
jgi:thiamine transporter